MSNYVRIFHSSVYSFLIIFNKVTTILKIFYLIAYRISKHVFRDEPLRKLRFLILFTRNRTVVARVAQVLTPRANSLSLLSFKNCKKEPSWVLNREPLLVKKMIFHEIPSVEI